MNTEKLRSDASIRLLTAHHQMTRTTGQAADASAEHLAICGLH